MKIPRCLTINNKVFHSSKYSDVINKSLIYGLNQMSNLSDWVLELEGMSGNSFRHFVNQLANKMTDCRILEIGPWKGSVSVSFGFLNEHIEMTVIDAWVRSDKRFATKKSKLKNKQKQAKRRRKTRKGERARFVVPRKKKNTDIQYWLNGNPQIDFENNIAKMKDQGGCQNVIVHKKDFRKLKLKESKFNLFFYDGPPLEKDCYDGLSLFISNVDDEFIFIIDDWNCKTVQSGINEAIEKNNLIIKHQIEIIDECKVFRTGGYFHNGISIFVLQKSQHPA